LVSNEQFPKLTNLLNQQYSVTCEEENSLRRPLVQSVKDKLVPEIKKILEEMKKAIRIGIPLPFLFLFLFLFLFCSSLTFL